MRPRRSSEGGGDELLMGRFRILERIGAGGMGTVYRAVDERLQRQVALKEIPSAEPARVLREAQAAARLNHPGIVTLYELGQRDGHALLVSELVPGPTLSRLHEAGRLRDRDVAEIAADLSDALAHAHARGVIHRDVKPQNVIVRDDQGAGQRQVSGTLDRRRADDCRRRGRRHARRRPSSRRQPQALTAFTRPALTAFERWSGENLAAEEAWRRPCGGSARNAALCAYRPDLPSPPPRSTRPGPEPELRPTA
jgi:serine/threonine protein kinase